MPAPTIKRLTRSALTTVLTSPAAFVVPEPITDTTFCAPLPATNSTFLLATGWLRSLSSLNVTAIDDDLDVEPTTPMTPSAGSNAVNTNDLIAS